MANPTMYMNDEDDIPAGRVSYGNNNDANDSSDEMTRLKNIRMRRGKWTEEEEAYTMKLTEAFIAGVLALPQGTTLRSFLSERLCCDPMRVTKKFAGSNGIGKQIFSPAPECEKTVEVRKMFQMELKDLEEVFYKRIDQSIPAPSDANPVMNKSNYEIIRNGYAVLYPGTASAPMNYAELLNYIAEVKKNPVPPPSRYSAPQPTGKPVSALTTANVAAVATAASASMASAAMTMRTAKSTSVSAAAARKSQQYTSVYGGRSQQYTVAAPSQPGDPRLSYAELLANITDRRNAPHPPPSLPMPTATTTAVAQAAVERRPTERKAAPASQSVPSVLARPTVAPPGFKSVNSKLPSVYSDEYRVEGVALARLPVSPKPNTLMAQQQQAREKKPKKQRSKKPKEARQSSHHAAVAVDLDASALLLNFFRTARDQDISSDDSGGDSSNTNKRRLDTMGSYDVDLLEQPKKLSRLAV